MPAPDTMRGRVNTKSPIARGVTSQWLAHTTTHTHIHTHTRTQQSEWETIVGGAIFCWANGLLTNNWLTVMGVATIHHWIRSRLHTHARTSTWLCEWMAGVIMIWPHGIEITLFGTCRDNQRKLLASLNLSIYIARPNYKKKLCPHSQYISRQIVK